MRKVIFSFLAAVLLALPVATLALGQMTEPIVIEDAQRGESYEQEIFIINNEENVAKIDLVAEGEMG